MARSTITQGLIDFIARHGATSARQLNHMPFIEKGASSDCSPLLIAQGKSGALIISQALGPTDVRNQFYFSSTSGSASPKGASYEHIFPNAIKRKHASTSSFGLYINTARLPVDADAVWPDAVHRDLEAFIAMDIESTNALNQRSKQFVSRGAKSFAKNLESVYSKTFKIAPGKHVSYMHTDTLDVFASKLEQAAWDQFLLEGNARQELADPDIQRYFLSSFPELLFEHQQLTADGDIFSRPNVMSLCPAATIIHDISALTDDLSTRLSMLRGQPQSQQYPAVGLPLPAMDIQ